MEIARHWRLRGTRLRLEGIVIDNGNGQKKFSVDGAHYTESPNGQHESENPLEAKTTYQTEEISGGNGRQPVKGSVVISAPAD